MAYDGLVMAAVAHELTNWLEARVEKIYQPESALLVILLHHQGLGRAKLLLSAEPARSRLHLSTAKLQNPKAPPMFCMLLRKYLEGGKLQQINQHGLDRILTLEFSGKDELGNSVTYRLISEIMGRHSNIVLVNQEDRILDAIVRVPPAMSSVHIVLPGMYYSAPEHQSRLDTLAVLDVDMLRQAMLATPDRPLRKALVGQLTGISPLLADELMVRAEIERSRTVEAVSPDEWHALMRQIANLQQIVKTKSFSPTVCGRDYSALELSSPLARPWAGTMNELVDKFTSQEQQRRSLEQQKQRLIGKTRQVLQKNLRKRQYQEEELALMQADLGLNRCGELILASQQLIPEKVESAKVVDYYDPELSEKEIKLDPRLTAVQNAQRYFRRYQRARHGIPIVEKNLDQTKSAIGYLETLLDSIERADQPELLQEISQEMQQAGLMPAPAKAKREQPTASEPLSFTAPDGCTILVGRNNLQNERLTRSADSEDWWLHAKDIPGSHVIVKTNGGELSDAALQMAAGLAACYSQARQSSKVPVDYTRKKHVRKPSGSPPGFVIYTHQQTVMVEPHCPVQPEE